MLLLFCSYAALAQTSSYAEYGKATFDATCLVVDMPLSKVTRNFAGKSLTSNLGVTHGVVGATGNQGIANMAYYFDGIDDYIELNSSTPVITAGPLTITISAKLESGGATVQAPLFVQRGNPTTTGRSMIGCFAQNGNNQIAFLIKDDVSSSASKVFYPTPTDGEWHNYGFVLDGNNEMHIYLDGVKVSSGTSTQNSSNLAVNVDYVSLGRHQYTTPSLVEAGWFKGSMSNFRVFNCALNDTEIVLASELKRTTIADTRYYTNNANTSGAFNFYVTMTENTTGYPYRGLIRFDDFQGTLGSNIVVDSAKLEYSLRWNSYQINFESSGLHILRVTEDWDEFLVSGVNEPNADASDQITVPYYVASTSRYWDAVDVTDHVQYFVDNPSDYHGWQFRLTDEDNVNRNVPITSSDYHYSQDQYFPKLKVWYHEEEPTLPVYLSASSSEGLIFNNDRSGVVLNDDFTANPIYIQSEQSSKLSGGKVEFSVSEDFEGSIGLDSDASIAEVNYVSHFEFDGDNYYLYAGATQITSGVQKSSEKYRFQRDGETLKIYYGTNELHSMTVSEINERLQIVSETDAVGHITGVLSDYDWPADPFAGLNYSTITSTGGGTISVTGNSEYYYMWNATLEDFLSCSELSDLNTARNNYVNADDHLTLSSFNWTELTCSQYQDYLTNNTSYTTNGVFPTTLLAYNPETGKSYTKVIDIPNKLIIAYEGSSVEVDADTRDWVRETPGTQYDETGLIVPMNSTRSDVYSSVSFEANDMEAEYAIGLLKDGWDYTVDNLPTYGFIIKDGTYLLITNGSVSTPVTFNVGDRFEIGKEEGQLYFIRNGLKLETPTISDEKYSVGAYVLKGKIEEPVLTGMSIEPELTVIDAGDYCGLEKVAYYRSNAELDLPPILKDGIKLPKTGSFGTNYIWRDSQDNIVSNSPTLITGEPGLYSLEVQTYTPYWVSQQFLDNFLVGYPVEWKNLVGVETPVAHSAKVETPGNFAGYQTYPVTLDTYGKSSNKIKEVINTDYVSFSMPTISFVASSYPANPWIPPQDILSYTDDAGNPLFSVIVLYDVHINNGPGLVGTNRVITPKSIGIRYHAGTGNVQWYTLSAYDLSGENVNVVAVHDYNSDKTKLYVSGRLALTATVTPYAMIGGSASQAQDLSLTYSYIHQQDFIYGFAGFDCGPNGLKNIITSRSCPSLPYYEMWTKENGNTVLSYENTLGIRFYEDYTSVGQELSFKLYTNTGIEHTIPSGVSFSKEFGENRILIRLTDLNIVKGESYLLEAENEKGEKRYLRFTY
jgi:hypothetical protein